MHELNKLKKLSLPLMLDRCLRWNLDIILG